MAVRERSKRVGRNGTVETADTVADTKQYTIKGIEADTLDKVRTAARKEGMKVGAWISRRLANAAAKALEDTPAPPDTYQTLRCELQKLESCQREDRDRLISIQKGLDDIVKAQHSMMATLLHK